MAYGSYVDLSDADNFKELVQDLLTEMIEFHPELVRKQKTHLVHIPDDMINYGPPVGFATERYDA